MIGTPLDETGQLWSTTQLLMLLQQVIIQLGGKGGIRQGDAGMPQRLDVPHILLINFCASVIGPQKDSRVWSGQEYLICTKGPLCWGIYSAYIF